MAKKFPLQPAHPERICWGCDRYCPADAMLCGNGSVATLHPAELFGADWMTWVPGTAAPDAPQSPQPAVPPDGAAPDGPLR
jgi:hypothetical protein